MKAKVLCDGNDGTQHYDAGDVCTRDSEWLRRLLVNGLAEPLDKAAEAVVADKDQKARHTSPVLRKAARDLPKE